MEKVRVLFVCMGNICRSPTAEGVLRHKLRERGLDAWVEVDSAGTHSWHIGAPPDERTQAHAGRRGYDLSELRARMLEPDDFDRFDFVLVMDDDNFDHARAICPPARLGRIERLMAYAGRNAQREVPDPFAGGPAGFERVLDMVERACDGLVAALEKRRGNFRG
jgi:protein-tyrosine phosphatase